MERDDQPGCLLPSRRLTGGLLVFGAPLLADSVPGSDRFFLPELGQLTRRHAEILENVAIVGFCPALAPLVGGFKRDLVVALAGGVLRTSVRIA